MGGLDMQGKEGGRWGKQPSLVETMQPFQL